MHNSSFNSGQSARLVIVFSILSLMACGQSPAPQEQGTSNPTDTTGSPDVETIRTDSRAHIYLDIVDDHERERSWLDAGLINQNMGDKPGVTGTSVQGCLVSDERVVESAVNTIFDPVVSHTARAFSMAISFDDEQVSTFIGSPLSGEVSYAFEHAYLQDAVSLALRFDIANPDTGESVSLNILPNDPLMVSTPFWPDVVTPSSEFSWQSPTDSAANSVIQIQASSFAAPGSGVVSVWCEAQDNGYFSFPTHIREAMGEAFASTHYQIERISRTTQMLGDIPVLATRSSVGSLLVP